MPDDFETTSKLLADAAVAANDPDRLKAWWVYRMLLGPDPLGERLTLLWHGHFATSNLKVANLGAMKRQNDSLRALARAPFGALLERLIHDPALLVWLDAPANRRGHPNENLARELMELFTLGIGHYSENDVREAARALTGCTIKDGTFRHAEADHDSGEKTIIQRKGRWTGDDLIKLLLDSPATARRLAWRLCTMLMGERACDDAAADALASGLKERDLDIGWGIATILRSRAFFAEANLGSRVIGPVEFVVGAARALEVFDPAPSTLVLADWAARQGQDLFYPPNVGGWPGGRAWLTSRALIGRANYATALVDGRAVGLTKPLEIEDLAARHGRDREQSLGFFAQLLLGSEPQHDGSVRLRTAANSGPEALRRGVAAILASPEAQVC